MFTAAADLLNRAKRAREDAQQTPRGSIMIFCSRNELSTFHFTLYPYFLKPKKCFIVWEGGLVGGRVEILFPL